MKKYFTLTAIIIGLLIASMTAACTQTAQTNQKQTAIVSKGNIAITVTADGNLNMPHEAKLRFGTPGTVKTVYVKEGDIVKAGTLLAKLDDTAQKIAITAAQYDIELALNELAEKVYPSLLGYPNYYPSFTALLRVEQAQEELNQAVLSLKIKDYASAASDLRVIYHDLESSKQTLNAPLTEIGNYPEIASQYLGTTDNWQQYYPAIPNAVNILEQDLKMLSDIQRLLETGDYPNAETSTNQFDMNLKKTHDLVDNACGRVVRTGIVYPDASTSLSVIKQVEASLNEMQSLMNEGNLDKLEYAEKMRMAIHDLEVSRSILESNELLLKAGLNLKQLRQYNLNYQKAEETLKKYKDELMKTEILAPFDGTVVEVDVKENDQLSAYDYSSKIAVHLVDTKTVEINGVVDEVDIFNVKKGQKADIIVDALPARTLTGEVTFVSPFSTQVAGVVNYPVTIALNPVDIDLKGGLTATANIIVEGREDVLIVPNGAVKGTEGDQWVEMVVDKDKGKFEKRTVTTGLQNNLNTEILSGLNEGDEVFVEKARTTRSIL